MYEIFFFLLFNGEYVPLDIEEPMYFETQLDCDYVGKEVKDAIEADLVPDASITWACEERVVI